MSKAENILNKMRNNPKGDWTIENLKTIAKRYNVRFRQPGTSHVTFQASNGIRVTVPAHRPIKPVYITAFVAMIDSIEE